jgi:hypothetical protein
MRPNKGMLVACVVASVALGVMAAAEAPAAPASAVAAKKKCKKRHSSKANRRCKKKRRSDATRSPLIRATLTWANGGADDVDMDLFVFDGAGGMAGNGTDTIPLSTITPDVSGPAGRETFTDSLFTLQAARDLSFGVCYSAGMPVQTDFTLTYVTADGVVHGDSQSPRGTSRFDYPAGPSVPSGFCSR